MLPCLKTVNLGSYHLLRVILGSVFIYSGAVKLADVKGFARMISQYDLVPDQFLAPAAIGLPVIELLAGVGLIFEIAGALTAIFGMLLMFIAVLWYGILKDLDIEGIIKLLESTGFEAVELRTGHKHGVEPSLSKEERAKVRERFARSKVKLLSYGTTCEFQSPDPAVRQKNIEMGKQFVDLAHDTGAWAIKVRPNGLPKDVPQETVVKNIGASLRELGEYGKGRGIEVWMEVHGRDTQVPAVSAAIMKAANHPSVGACWNSNPTDVVNGSVKPSFELLKPYIKSAHINELANEKYPWRELFTLMRQAKYDRYTLCECAESKEPERFLRYYRALWKELSR